RYDDPWKGLTLQDPAKRFQTKEITFYPFNAERGDTVLIVARVRNLGLVNTEVPICVSFYHGDPDNGGVLLVGTDGSTKVSTAALIPARSWSTVQFPWRVPPEIQQYPRIYAKINPDTVMDEIHTNNNKGFAVFPLSSLPLGVSDKQGSQSLPNKFSLSQNYPNPFNPTTTINFNLPKASNVTLKIFNILGEEVATLVSKRLPAGSHSYQWSRTGGIASGIYLYRLRAGNFVETKKMVLLR
ncbi:MAG: T9SS type A sorting domain-containing protein, partial [Calditrichota bacterium]